MDNTVYVIKLEKDVYLRNFDRFEAKQTKQIMCAFYLTKQTVNLNFNRFIKHHKNKFPNAKVVPYKLISESDYKKLQDKLEEAIQRCERAESNNVRCDDELADAMFKELGYELDFENIYGYRDMENTIIYKKGIYPSFEVQFFIKEQLHTVRYLTTGLPTSLSVDKKLNNAIQQKRRELGRLNE